MLTQHCLKGPGICLAVFLPTLVMGNFMVLNLFLALLLNSFNSEELKTRKEVKTKPKYAKQKVQINPNLKFLFYNSSHQNLNTLYSLCLTYFWEHVDT